jgi:hypothetical protein
MAAPADPLKADFRLFATVIWRHLNLPDPTPVQRDICLWLQHGPRRRGVMAFRGVGKSWLTAAYSLWRLYCEPQTRILVVSASKAKADEFSAFAKQLLADVPLLAHLKAKEGQRDSMLAFDVGPAQPDIAPSVKSCGITGQITGSRANLIIADDIEIPSNSLSQVMRDRLWEQVKEFDAILKPGGDIVYLGTPQTAMSLYNELPNRGYEFRVWPVRVPNPEDYPNFEEGYAPQLAPMISDAVRAALYGLSVEPTRFGDRDISERELSYGRSGFRLQFMLDTSLSDANRYPLKVSDLIILSFDPHEAPLKLVWAREPDLICEGLPNVAFPGDKMYRPMNRSDDTAPFTGTVMFIDPSGRGKDETAYAIVSSLHGRLFLRECRGLEGGYDEKTVLRPLAEAAKRHKVTWVRIEDNFGDGMFTQLLKPVLRQVYPVVTENVKHHGQKELRVIDTLEPVMNAHKLVVDPEVIRYDYTNQNVSQGLEKAKDFMLIYQMTRITREKGALSHDDRIEALAGAVAFWVEQMAQDEETKEKEYKQLLIDEELRKFMESVGAPGTPTGEGTFGSLI